MEKTTAAQHAFSSPFMAGLRLKEQQLPLSIFCPHHFPQPNFWVFNKVKWQNMRKLASLCFPMECSTPGVGETLSLDHFSRWDESLVSVWFQAFTESRSWVLKIYTPLGFDLVSVSVSVFFFHCTGTCSNLLLFLVKWGRTMFSSLLLFETLEE